MIALSLLGGQLISSPSTTYFHAKSCRPEKSRKNGMRAGLAAQIWSFLFPVLC